MHIFIFVYTLCIYIKIHTYCFHLFIYIFISKQSIPSIEIQPALMQAGRRASQVDAGDDSAVEEQRSQKENAGVIVINT